MGLILRHSRVAIHSVLYPAWICGLSPIDGLSIWPTFNKGVDLQLHWQCAATRAQSMFGPCSILRSILDLQVICHEQNLLALVPCDKTSHGRLWLSIIFNTWR